ncbi:MAG: 5'/3'-nucleotidase SurE [Candidatus Omnitrophota bacterium]|jgi:5'-nucleotidase
MPGKKEKRRSGRGKASILLTNDDGIHAPGLTALYEALLPLGNVTVVAPEHERSAVSHAITLHQPLRLRQVRLKDGLSGYCTNGTPADCVKLGVRAVLKSFPDIVVSGINPGPNTGFSVLYSGTVSAAREGAMYGIPSMAVSLASHAPDVDFSYAASFAALLARKIISGCFMPSGSLLNVNIPAGAVKGVKFTKQSVQVFKDQFEKRKDPRNREYYWLSGEFFGGNRDADMDSEAVRRGYISLTPLNCDVTNHALLAELRKKQSMAIVKKHEARSMKDEMCYPEKG